MRLLAGVSSTNQNTTSTYNTRGNIIMSEFLSEVNFILSCEKVHSLVRAAKLQVPVQPSQISRAVQLLGNSINSKLGSRSERELKNLLGDLPTNIEEARLWKSALKALIKET